MQTPKQFFLEPTTPLTQEGNPDSHFASTTYLRTKREVEDIDAIAIDQEFSKMSKLQDAAPRRASLPVHHQYF